MPCALLCFGSAALEHLALSPLLLKLALQLCKGVRCRLWRRLPLPFCELSVVFFQIQSVNLPDAVEAPTLHEEVPLSRARVGRQICTMLKA